jgi:hypothetical protein
MSGQPYRDVRVHAARVPAVSCSPAPRSRREGRRSSEELHGDIAEMLRPFCLDYLRRRGLEAPDGAA